LLLVFDVNEMLARINHHDNQTAMVDRVGTDFFFYFF